MLAELHVAELGVISDLDVTLGEGLTVLTGETGAGKTLVVEALSLLLGGKSDPAMVRAGAEEAVVEGRFVLGDEELVLARTVPRSGRSRAFVDTKMAPLSLLEEHGRELVDLYGQHAHQSLLRAAHQRACLDRFAGVDLGPLHALRRDLQVLSERIDALGGDTATRQHELDLLAYEVAEIEAAAITGPDEATALEALEDRLAGATALREAATRAHDTLAGELGPAALELLGDALDALARHAPLRAHHARLSSLQLELDDLVASLREAAESLEEDPVQLEAVRQRRQLLRGLVRKHGDSLADVLQAAAAARLRIEELTESDATRARLERERAELHRAIDACEQAIGDQRRAHAGRLGRDVEVHLGDLGLHRARLEIALSHSGLANDVEFLFGANPGEPVAPLTKVASGGELARTMLALRLVLSSGPATLVFDEVDAGIGGAAALAVGHALAALAREHQVLVVTHLAQVAAGADRHLVVEKDEHDGRTLARVLEVTGEERVGELSRMLAGNPTSAAGRRHAEELIAEARALSPG